MGNCMFKPYDTTTSTTVLHHHVAAAAHEQMIKVVTSNGGIMELYAPITAEQITSEFQGHGLFRSPDPAQSDRLLHKDQLHPGQLYYLLPLSSNSSTKTATSEALSTPYRMSFDAPRVMFKRSDPDLVPQYNGTGVWKVRLVIHPEQLSEILSQDAKTEELIESVRTIAKCGTNGGTASTASISGSNSDDQCSVSSCNFHWKALYDH